MKEEYDFVVIGGGSAGYAAARTAHDFGLSTAVVDGAETLGGLCILRGCMPSKALIESANRTRAIREAGKFGIEVSGHRVFPRAIVERKREVIGEFAEYRQDQLEDGRFDLFRGRAAFAGPNELIVQPKDGGEEFSLRFRTACVATGSKIARVPIPGIEETGYWTSDDFLDAEELPDSMIVLGGGAIALELACYLEGLGKEVTVIQRSDQVLTGTDRDVADALLEAMREREFLTVYTGTSLEEVSRTKNGRKQVRFSHGEETVTVEADEILQSLGRVPNTDGLELNAAGVSLGENGKHVDCGRDQRTTAEHIFAAGDVCGPFEVVHTAIEQGEAAAANAAALLGVEKATVRELDYRLQLLGIFTEPQVATVGLSEMDACAAGREVVAASYPFDDHGMSILKDHTKGFVKLIADKETRELVGGAVVGPEATELIHEIVVALYFRASARDFIKIPHYHPTLSEIWLYPAEDLLN